MTERARFCLTNLKVRRLIRKASRSDVMRSSSSTTSLISRATSEPLPIAMAMSLFESAKASLIPSPAMTTTRPSACSLSISSAFSSGKSPAR